MVQSLAALFNRVEEENKTPIQWRETIIKSVYKGEHEGRRQESQRGILQMSIACKLYMKEWRNSKMKINKQIYQVCKQQEKKTGQL